MNTAAKPMGRVKARILERVRELEVEFKEAMESLERAEDQARSTFHLCNHLGKLKAALDNARRLAGIQPHEIQTSL